MELEVGQFVRTDNGIIGKIIGFKGDMIETDNKRLITYKSSHSECKIKEKLIDLIEVGDYVNGSKVQEIRKNYIEIEEYSGLNNDEPCILKSEDIQSIVTKERFEKMTYIIEKGDDK